MCLKFRYILDLYYRIPNEWPMRTPVSIENVMNMLIIREEWSAPLQRDLKLNHK